MSYDEHDTHYGELEQIINNNIVETAGCGVKSWGAISSALKTDQFNAWLYKKGAGTLVASVWLAWNNHKNTWSVQAIPARGTSFVSRSVVRIYTSFADAKARWQTLINNKIQEAS